MSVSQDSLAKLTFSAGTLRAFAESAALRQAVLTLADQMVASLTTFLTGVIVGRTCAAEEFGFYMLGFSLYTLTLTLQSSVIGTPFQIYFPRKTASTAPYFTGNFLLQQMALGIGIAFLVGGGAIFSGFMETGLTRLLIALALAIEFLLLRDFIRQIYFAQLNSAGVLVFDVLLAAGQMMVLLGLSSAGLLNASSAYLALGLVCLVGACGWYFSQRAQLRMSVSKAVLEFRKNWPAVKWLLASGLLWSLSTNLYAWLLAGFHGAASAGAWGAALGVVTIINPLSIGAQNYFGPRICQAYAKAGLSALNRVLLWSTALYAGSLAVFSLVMLLLGDPLVIAIYGDKYAGNGVIVAVLALNFAINAAGFTISRGLFAIEKAKIDFQVNVLAFASMLLVGIWLARYYGPLGAAAGQAFTNAIACGIRGAAYVISQRRMGQEAIA